jgi:hypothetical protein
MKLALSAGIFVRAVIDTVEKAASTAVRVYKAVKPIATAILTNGRKTK